MTEENNINEEVEKEEEREEEEQEMTLPMIPLRGLTVFPNMVLHFDIGREKSINALEKAMVLNQYIFLSAQKDENTDLPTAEDFYHWKNQTDAETAGRLYKSTGRRRVQREN